MQRRGFLATVIAALSITLGPVVEAAPPTASGKWEKSIRAFEAADKRSPPPAGAVLFVGSSSIRLWKSLPKDLPQYRVINRGFGGSQIADATHFADRIILPYRPSVIILHAGSNDLAAGKTPEEVCADFGAFVEKIHSVMPEIPIAFLSINPTPARWSQAEKQKAANQLIRKYIASKQRLAYIDQWNALLTSDGQPRPDLHIADRLHPNAAGYAIRAKLVTTYLDSLHLSKK